MINIFLFLVSVTYAWPNFILYSQNNSYSISFVVSNIIASELKNSRPNIFLIHGFGDSPVRTKLNQLKDAILTTNDANVFIVNWEKGSLFPFYTHAIKNAQIVSEKLAHFIVMNKLIDIHCIGHSMGAHICGLTGKKTKLKRISGLDPAGPGYFTVPANQRLHKTDADFVDVIHTDSIVGLGKAIGHKDFYPSGGLIQPSCLLGGDKTEQSYLVDLFSCSHFRVLDFYIESIKNSKCQFKATKCENYLHYLSGLCLNINISSMGYYADAKNPPLTNESGSFYLSTNKNYPYCVE